MSEQMYSQELKLEIIQRHLEKGESVALLARVRVSQLYH